MTNDIDALGEAIRDSHFQRLREPEGAAPCISFGMDKHRDIYASAARAHLDSLKNGGWKTIESAPRDGTVILSYLASLLPVNRYRLVYWDTEISAWYYSNGIGAIEPDFWKPLDPPPALQNDKGGENV